MPGGSGAHIVSRGGDERRVRLLQSIENVYHKMRSLERVYPENYLKKQKPRNIYVGASVTEWRPFVKMSVVTIHRIYKINF